jgi:hypothetical protein
VKIGPAVYLAIEGRGAPGGPEFQAAIGALYGMAYTVKMTRKFEGKRDYVVGKLEAQWWADGGDDFSREPKELWRWKLLIRTPEFVKAAELRRAAATLLKRGKGEAVDLVALETIQEGECVQMLHVGPYEREGETVAAMQAFAESKGRAFGGRHHEIYLSDPRRVAPAKLKTILRVPVTRRR